MQKIAVWNTAFLGDAILTLPLIQTLKRAWPEAAIDFYTRRGFSSLFREHPALKAVFEYDKRSSGAAGLPAYGRELRARGYDLWISAHQSIRSALIARSSGAPRRIGYAGPWFSRLFYTDRVERRFRELHEVERLLQLVGPLGLKDISDWPELALPTAATDKAAVFFADIPASGGSGAAGPVLGMHPGSVWGTKRWPVEYFAAIGVRAAEAGAGIVIFAGPGEEDMADEAERRIRNSLEPEAQGRVRNLAGKLSLVELAAFIGRLDCYLTNDSGPMHMAWAQRVPVVALFGPTVRELGFAPRGEGDGGAVLLENADLGCRPCGLHGPRVCPRKHHRCMTELTPDLVWPHVRARLEAAGLEAARIEASNTLL